MLAKSWKKILLVILIIACLWNIISKIAHSLELKSVFETNNTTVQEQEENTNRENII